MDMIMDKKKLDTLLERALEDYKVYAPVDRDGTVLFRQIDSTSEPNLEYFNSKLPPKSLVFPQTETLFKFRKGENIELEEPGLEDKILLFGIRPCDARSFSILDRVFDDEYKDPYYLKRRKNTLIIGLSCLHPGTNCFCTSVGGGPSDTQGMDLLFTDLGDRYFVEVVTEKGEQFIARADDLFTGAGGEDREERKEAERKATALIRREMDTDGIEERLDSIFESDYWSRIAMKCLGCGICTYLCPTCHCFDIQDETARNKGGRVRIWDSCMFPEYTLQASGYNPRPGRKNRIRNRVYHKYNYYPKNGDVIACVGCGRCIDACPANIDIIEVINNTRGAVQ